MDIKLFLLLLGTAMIIYVFYQNKEKFNGTGGLINSDVPEEYARNQCNGIPCPPVIKHTGKHNPVYLKDFNCYCYQ